MPLAQDAADRPYPGADLLEEALLRRLGPDDYKKLLTSRLPFGNPRVIEVMTWVRQHADLVLRRAYPGCGDRTAARLLPLCRRALRALPAFAWFTTVLLSYVLVSIL
jgi:hypothetical protein